ncbi:MAG TPA: hypothetical protein VLA13_06340 [Massilibacterium sp.]|nr:hypothetical protein [Massilibacterium sp.]
MKKTAVNIAVLIAVFVIAWYSRGAIAPKIVDNTQIDTVYVDKEYKVTEIKEVEKPVRVTEYQTDTVKVESVRVEKDTVYVSSLDNTFAYDASFLTQYPNSPRFLGLRKEGGKLNLTYQSTSGLTRGKTWQVGNRGYTVGLSGGEPNINTFNDNKFDLSSSLEAGVMLGLSNRPNLYLQGNVDMSMYGVTLSPSLIVSKTPNIKLGVKHEF